MVTHSNHRFPSFHSLSLSLSHFLLFQVVGNKHNTLIFDIKSSRVSKLQTQISTTSASSLTSLPTLASLDGSTTTNAQQQPQCNSNGTSNNNCNNHSHPQQQQIALFVCIAGDNESRSRYQFYIEDTFR